MKTLEYIAVTALALLFSAWVATTAIKAIENSFVQTATLIEKAGQP